MPVQPLTLADCPGGKAKTVGGDRKHVYVLCGHSVEDHRCLYPPTHTRDSIITSQPGDFVEKYNSKCNMCEEKGLVLDTLVCEVKKQASRLLKDEMESDAITLKSVKWSSSTKLILTFSYDKKRASHAEQAQPTTLVVEIVPDPDTEQIQWNKVMIKFKLPEEDQSFDCTNAVATSVLQYEYKWNEQHSPVSGESDDLSEGTLEMIREHARMAMEAYHRISTR